MENVRIKKLISKTKLLTLVFSGAILTLCTTGCKKSTVDIKKIENVYTDDSIDLSDSKPKEDFKKYEYIPSINDNIQTSNSSETVYVSDEVDESLLNEQISFEQSDLDNMLSVISFTTDYKYGEYFNVENSLEQYEQYKYNSIDSQNIIKNNKIDLNKMYEIVLNNNQLYENKKYYEQFTNNEIYNFCKIISENLNEKISNLEINLNDLDYNLSNLKIMGYTGFVYATINSDNCLIINEKKIETLKQDDGLEKILAHEAMHLIQKTTDNNHVGISYKFENSNINPLYNKWFLEASAQRTILKNDERSSLYINELNYLNALSVASINSSQKIEEFNFTKNLDEFHELFSCNGIISKEEIISMMYAIDFITTEDKTFLKENKIELDVYETNDLIYKYASQVFETLSKKFYYDLSIILKEKHSLKDIFSLISLFENVCSNQIFYDNTYRFDSNSEFIKKYIDINENLFRIISEKTNIDIGELYNLYDYNNKKDINIKFTCKDDELNYIYSRVKYNKISSIHSIYGNIKQKNK